MVEKSTEVLNHLNFENTENNKKFCGSNKFFAQWWWRWNWFYNLKGIQEAMSMNVWWTDDLVDSYRVEVLHWVIDQIMINIIEYISNDHDICNRKFLIQIICKNSKMPCHQKSWKTYAFDFISTINYNVSIFRVETLKFIHVTDLWNLWIIKSPESEQMLQTRFVVIAGSRCNSGKSYKKC